ncbi:MAG: DUF2975 domain-containing protein [Agriterribacter sp.]
MIIRIETKYIIRILYVLSFIIFVGLCIHAGACITNAVLAIAKPGMVKFLWQVADLNELFNYDRGYFFVVTLLMSIVAVSKAVLFYMIISMLHSRNFSITRPFSEEVRRFIIKLSYMALLIGLFSGYGVRYTAWLTLKGIKMPDIQYLKLGGADVWLFMSIILFVIAQIFKRGIEIQTENELTV